jgi:hypothetical protein
MKQMELASKLVLAIIVGLTSVGAILVVPPAYSTTTTTPIPNNNTTSSSSDDNGNGRQVPSEEDIRDLVGGAITDALQLKVVAISGPSRDITPNSGASFEVGCPQGMLATGGGFSTNGAPVEVVLFQPDLSGGNDIRSGQTPDEWHSILSNPNQAPITVQAWAVCVGLGQ